MNRGSIAEIDLSAIAQNLQFVKRVANNRPVIAVVKADAYGHGAVAVSKKLLQCGVSCLAVAFGSEARELRESGIDAPILVLFDHGEIRDYFDYGFVPVISGMDTARQISREAENRGTAMKVHVKIDTGMGRLGFQVHEITDNIMKIFQMPGLEVTGIMSHFSEADLANGDYAMIQIERFNAIRAYIEGKTGKPLLSHIANSAAVMTLGQACFDAVRPGLMLYGYSPFPGHAHSDLIPAMTVKARIIDIRDVPEGTPISYGRTFVTKRRSRIGVLAIGYADGFSRHFSNNARVLVKGRAAPVAGRVCMDLTMIDLTDVPGVERNDEAVIVGRQGDHAITADELASRAGTIAYEILTSLGSKANRVYVKDH